jgi:hypothetical protein
MATTKTQDTRTDEHANAATIETQDLVQAQLSELLLRLDILQRENDRIKAHMWGKDGINEPPPTKVDPDDLKTVTVLYGYGKVGAKDKVWVGGANGTTWLFEGGVCRNVPMSVAKHWKANTRPDGTPVLGYIDCHILPNDAKEIDFIEATGGKSLNADQAAAVIAASDLSKLANALPKTTRDLLIRRLQDVTE